jgi:hypothetical protein
MTLAVVEVEPWVLPASAGAEVGGKPTAAADVGAATADEAGRSVMVVHHPVPARSTARRSYHNLPLLCFLLGADCIIHDDDIADKLWE